MMQPEPQVTPDAAAEIEFIRGLVGRYFPIYETNVSYDSVSFRCRVDESTLDDYFSRLREELGKNGYTPVITYRGGEHVITVGKLPPVSAKGIWVNFVLLIATIGTTVMAGTLLWRGYVDHQGSFFSPEVVMMGALTFALPLMGILGIHEMGHYFMARKRGVPASLPFFIPVPPFSVFPLGTFGAFISLRGPIPDRRTLFDLGVAGPIAGFIATIPVAIIGIMLTNSGAVPVPAETGGMVSVMMPPVYMLLMGFMPPMGDYLLHPTGFAAWVGFLVTAINLLPAGSLDGGHIARAALGANARYLSWASVIALFVVGAVFYIGWMLFAMIILFLGISHPPPLNDITRISDKRRLTGFGMAVMLVISFAYAPFVYISPDYSFNAELQGDNNATISISLNHTFILTLDNAGNVENTLVFVLLPADQEGLAFKIRQLMEDDHASEIKSRKVTIPVGGNATVLFDLYLASAINEDAVVNATIRIYAENNSLLREDISIVVTTLAGSYDYYIVPSSASASPGDRLEFAIIVNSSYPSTADLRLFVTNTPAGWSSWIFLDDEANATSQLILELEPMANITCTLVLKISDDASPDSVAQISVDSHSQSLPPRGPRTVTVTVI